MQKLEALPPPPGVIASLQAGFNVVSSRVTLIILPVMFDLLVWLGPRLSLRDWFASTLESWSSFLRPYGNSANEIAGTSQMLEAIDQVNWLGWARTFPIGIPSLMIDLQRDLFTETPLGIKNVIQLPSFVSIAGIFILLTVIGWLAGGWYFRLVARASLGERAPDLSFGSAFTQTVLLSVIWVIASLTVMVPILLVLSLLALINVILAQTVFLILLFFMFWLIVPLFFIPHGIFVLKQNALISIMSSLRMSRFTLPTSSMFVFAEFLLWLGLGYLWQVPYTNSWLRLVGIAGYAFISTMLLSASFVYYRDMTDWLQSVYERLQQVNNKSSIGKA